ncbi:hypothetical protein SpAn4DRAFT_5193 [Sporomusa ovata]|uniref:Uncharacterized protein n=1 Tax=Sporomusa ovata TaxID=2378 RepID=A0A0U1L1J2_9FIRM|nr:hypothetical protein SpAn4DRAFT_5193 [Sporomusa ovata]
MFFTRGGDLANLNLTLIYVRNNEHTNRMKIVTVVRADGEVPPRLVEDIRFLDRRIRKLILNLLCSAASSART